MTLIVTASEPAVVWIKAGIPGPPGVVGATAPVEYDAATQTLSVDGATTSARGVLKLSGDLAGTADTPTVPGLAAKADLVDGTVPVGQLPPNAFTIPFVVDVHTDLVTLTLAQPGDTAKVLDDDGHDTPAMYILEADGNPTVDADWISYPFDPTGAAAAAQAAAEAYTDAQIGALDLGSASREPSSAFDPAGAAAAAEASSDPAGSASAAQAAAAVDATTKANAAQAAAIAAAATDATSKANAAQTNAEAASDPAGSAAAVLTTSVQKAANGADFADPGTTRANLHVPALGAADVLINANVTLAGLQSFYAVPGADGLVGLCVAQSDATQNGPWVMHSGAWTRPTDFAHGATVKGRTITINNGTAWSGTTWILKATTPIVVDTDKQVWRSPALNVAADSVGGQQIFMVGNSFGAEPRAWVPIRYCERIAARTKGTLHNSSTGGALAHDIAKWLYGSITLVNPAGNSVTSTWAVSALNIGVGILELGRNDAGYDSDENSTKARAGYVNSIIALIRLMQASAWTQDTDASLAYTGTWTHSVANPTWRKGGSYHSTATPGDKVTITFTGTDCDVVLDGWDSASGFHGAAYTTTVDGVAGPSGTTNDAFAGAVYKHGTGETSTSILTPVTIGFHGMSAGTHTIVITHAGTAGQFLDVQGYLTRSPNPMTILVPKVNQLAAAGYTEYVGLGGTNASWAVDQIYNGLIDSSILPLFPDGSVQTFDVNGFGWDPSTCTLSDGLHPNDPTGTTVYADAAMCILNSLPARIGLSTFSGP